MTWMSWQIDYLLLLQNFREATNGIFDSFFLFISQLGVMPFTFIVLCTIYWGINKNLGIYMIYCMCFSFLINTFLKLTFCIYRPWLLDGRLQPTGNAMHTAPGYSFPSGHTAGATSFWGSIAMYFSNKKWIVYTCLFIIFLVMLSRNYLGVHTSQDVIVSFVVGIAIIFYTNKLLLWTKENKDGEDIAMALITIFSCILIIYIVFKPYPIDISNGKLVYDGTLAQQGGIATIINSYALLLGCYIENKYVKFNPKAGSIFEKINRVLIGLGLIFIIETFFFDYIFEILEEKPAKYITRFMSGLFITLIYPCLIKLSDSI
ncbi:phosphatase PAP2 family protein [bacterium]|nr:phosphatase PAP2 family protein [bacterium]